MIAIDVSYGWLQAGWALRTSVEEYLGEANKILLPKQFIWRG